LSPPRVETRVVARNITVHSATLFLPWGTAFPNRLSSAGNMIDERGGCSILPIPSALMQRLLSEEPNGRRAKQLV
jgi:hypothetical protein